MFMRTRRRVPQRHRSSLQLWQRHRSKFRDPPARMPSLDIDVLNYLGSTKTESIPGKEKESWPYQGLWDCGAAEGLGYWMVRRIGGRKSHSELHRVLIR